MRLLKEYPAGTPLKFQSVTTAVPGAVASMPIKPCAYPVQLWFDPRIVEPPIGGWPEVQCESYVAADSKKRVRGIAPVLGKQGSSHVMAFDSTIGNQRVLVLLDSGASCNFMSKSFADRLKAPVTKVVIPDVSIAGGGTIGVLGRICPRMHIQEHASNPSFLILDKVSDVYDVILGDPWFIQHKATLSWTQGGSCTVAKGSQRIVLEPVSRMIPTPGLPKPLDQIDKVQVGHSPEVQKCETLQKDENLVRVDNVQVGHSPAVQIGDTFQTIEVFEKVEKILSVKTSLGENLISEFTDPISPSSMRKINKQCLDNGNAPLLPD